jgi:hypothetical protein
MTNDQPPPLTFFTLKDGLVESDADQNQVNAFAADFQGLRHFGSKIGDVLNLGDAWTGTLLEENLTVTYAYLGKGTSAKDPGNGLLTAQETLLYESLSHVTSQEA